VNLPFASAQGAAGGFVVSSGTFTEEAIAFASGKNVTLVDGGKLFGLIQQAKVAREREERTEVLVKRRPVTPFSLGAVESTIVCPTCSRPWCAGSPSGATAPGARSGAAPATHPAGARDRSTPDNACVGTLSSEPVVPTAPRPRPP